MGGEGDPHKKIFLRRQAFRIMCGWQDGASPVQRKNRPLVQTTLGETNSRERRNLPKRKKGRVTICPYTATNRDIRGGHKTRAASRGRRHGNGNASF